MSLQTLHLTRPALTNRLANPAATLHPPTPRTLRRTELALLDGLQAWARAGRGLTALIAVDQPGPAFSFDLPIVQTDTPLMPSRYGVIAQLLTTISKQSEVRAAIRAEAHSLSLLLPRSVSTPETAAHPIESVAQLLQQIADQTALIVQIDKLHRADSESLEAAPGVDAGLGVAQHRHHWHLSRRSTLCAGIGGLVGRCECRPSGVCSGLGGRFAGVAG